MRVNNFNLRKIWLPVFVAVVALLISFLTLAPVRAASALAVNDIQEGLGQPLSISGDGFNSREKVVFWLTAPDGKVFDYSYTYATSDGQLESYSNETLSSNIASPGRWYITARGLDSGITTIASFYVTGPTLSASSVTGSNGENMVEVVGNNFIPGEKITIWVTDSRGNVKYLGYAWAYGQGQIAEGKSFSFSGGSDRYRVTAYGNTSGTYTVTSLLVQ